MKKTASYSFSALLLVLVGLLGSCRDFDPEYEKVGGLTPVSNLASKVVGHNIELTWTLPAGDVTGVRVMRDNSKIAELEGPATSYTVVGAPMGQDNLYTVKVLFADGHVSEGTSIVTQLPQEDLPNVTDLVCNVSGRTVTLTWKLPAAQGLTGVKVVVDGNDDAATLLAPTATEAVLKGQPTDREVNYSVKAVYDTYYAASGASLNQFIPFVPVQMGYLLTVDDYLDLPDDDERAAAAWFAGQANCTFVNYKDLATLDPEVVSALWVMIDRNGTPVGWKNLPAEVSSDAQIAALKNYMANGGNVYLSNMATQLSEPLGLVPEGWAPTVFGSGDGGTGTDVWVLQAYLGWDFRNGGDQGFYDRTAHAIYKGLKFEDPNGYGYDNLPLIGPGQREDHNCLWDCNIYGKGNQPDVIKNFEVTTNSLVLATWGHVRDHCVAAIVDFFPNDEHGRVIANGLAAYEWNQNSGPNIYQSNIEQLTLNIFEYLK